MAKWRARHCHAHLQELSRHKDWREGPAEAKLRLPGAWNVNSSVTLNSLQIPTLLMIHLGYRRRHHLRAANEVEMQTESDEELEKKMEEFLMKQAEIESGEHIAL